MAVVGGWNSSNPREIHSGSIAATPTLSSLGGSRVDTALCDKPVGVDSQRRIISN